MTEIEVKIKVDDFKKIEMELLKLNISKIIDWEFEDNIVFDFPELNLKNNGKLFRLRKTEDNNILTLKTPSESNDKRFKIREEYEVEVSDFRIMKKIIEHLGLKKFFRYQKYRKTYIIKNNHICFDKTPIGNFIEIEGDKQTILEIAKHIGKTEADFITSSYFVLFRESNKSGDMVFENMDE